MKYIFSIPKGIYSSNNNVYNIKMHYKWNYEWKIQYVKNNK